MDLREEEEEEEEDYDKQMTNSTLKSDEAPHSGERQLLRLVVLPEREEKMNKMEKEVPEQCSGGVVAEEEVGVVLGVKFCRVKSREKLYWKVITTTLGKIQMDQKGA